MAMDIVGEMYMLPLANSIIGSQLCLTCLINSALAKNPPNSSAYLPNEMSHFASWLANCEKKGHQLSVMPRRRKKTCFAMC